MPGRGKFRGTSFAGWGLNPSHTSAHPGSPSGGSALSHPDPGRERRGQGAQSQEGPLGKMTARPWGQACGACSRQEFSGPEITASAPLHSCPRPELATPGDGMLLPWELGSSAPLLALPPQPVGGPHTGGPGSARSWLKERLLRARELGEASGHRPWPGEVGAGHLQAWGTAPGTLLLLLA